MSMMARLQSVSCGMAVGMVFASRISMRHGFGKDAEVYNPMMGIERSRDGKTLSLALLFKVNAPMEGRK